jgi:hypothetical protein
MLGAPEMAAPHYSPEVRFYSRIGVSYGWGSKLRRMGVLVPDAFMDNDAPLFLCDALSLERQRQAVLNHKASVRAAQQNVLTNA